MHISKAHDYQPVVQALLVSLLLLLFSSELLAGGCRPARVVAGEHQGCMQVNNTADGSSQSRYYRLYTPKHYDSAADTDWKLLVVLHGGGGKPKAISRYSRLNSIARKQFDDDWIILYPEGLDRGWNDSRQRYTQDDVAFINALVSKHLPRRLGIHTKPGYYVTGISNGALMALHLFCQGQPLRGLGVVAATMNVELLDDCKPASRVPIMYVYGDQDTAFPIAGGPLRNPVRGKGNDIRGQVLSYQGTLEWFLDYNHCQPVASRTSVLDEKPGDGTRVHVSRYQSGCNTSPVVTYLVEAGGHRWPDEKASRLVGLLGVGKASREFNTGSALLELFSAPD